MDGSGITSTLHRGGGTVNCRYGIDSGENEVFYKETADGKVAFRSKTYDNVYLRIDFFEVESSTD